MGMNTKKFASLCMITISEELVRCVILNFSSQDLIINKDEMRQKFASTTKELLLNSFKIYLNDVFAAWAESKKHKKEKLIQKLNNFSPRINELEFKDETMTMNTMRSLLVVVHEFKPKHVLLITNEKQILEANLSYAD